MTDDRAAGQREPSGLAEPGDAAAGQHHWVEVPHWRLAPEAWRLSRRLSPRLVNTYLRLRTGRALPRSFRARFAAMQLPDDTVVRTLADIRGLGDWMSAWNRAAQRHLGEARREDASGRWQEAAIARRQAAMCYHAAHLITDTDSRTIRALRAASVAVFGQAIPLLMMETRRVTVRWRTSDLPGYLARTPARDPRGAPLVVMLNGATTTKEELLLWTQPYLAAGVSVLALDWPGTGEAHTVSRISGDCDDITDGIVAHAADDPVLDATRIALLGFSLGGVLAVRSAATDRRIAAAIAVTSPFDPRRWAHSVNPVVRQQLAGLAGEDRSIDHFAGDFSVADVISRLRSPLLVFGAGRDLVVPPEEALLLASGVGDLATLVWYADGAHGLYEYVDDWNALAATWLAEVLDATPPPGDMTEGVSLGDGAGDASYALSGVVPNGAGDGNRST